MNEVVYGHTPVLLDEVIEKLRIRPGGFYVDCTFGRGGHSRAIMQHLDQNGHLLAIDKDPFALENAGPELIADPRFRFFHGSFARLQEAVTADNPLHSVNGILYDLGVSSPQLDDPQRGFSFQHDGTLDMRMDTGSGITAADWINSTPVAEIERVLREFGEERFARRIARSIDSIRHQERISTTKQLAGIVTAVVPIREKNRHPATRTFQAIRIVINRELEELQESLDQAMQVLADGGRLLVISFHSLEDRIVKRFMRKHARGDDFPPEVPVTREQMHPQLKIIGKAIYPGAAEINDNPRSRSAVLRVAERMAA